METNCLLYLPVLNKLFSGNIAAMFITTEAVVYERPADEVAEAAGGHGHSHGPGGHSH
jgi:chaperonin GroEL